MACGGREVKKNIELDAESWLLITNQRYDVPLPPDEVRGIARSVERYRDHWKEQGLYYSDAETSAWCRRRGIKSGKVRRSLVKDRDAAIIQSVMSGESQADVGPSSGYRIGLSVRFWLGMLHCGNQDHRRMQRDKHVGEGTQKVTKPELNNTDDIGSLVLSRFQVLRGLYLAFGYRVLGPLSVSGLTWSLPCLRSSGLSGGVWRSIWG